jgi:hypothetical protein
MALAVSCGIWITERSASKPTNHEAWRGCYSGNVPRSSIGGAREYVDNARSSDLAISREISGSRSSSEENPGTEVLNEACLVLSSLAFNFRTTFALSSRNIKAPFDRYPGQARLARLHWVQPSGIWSHLVFRALQAWHPPDGFPQNTISVLRK